MVIHLSIQSLPAIQSHVIHNVTLTVDIIVVVNVVD